MRKPLFNRIPAVSLRVSGKLGIASFALLQAISAQAEETFSYERDIAPILRSHCAGCHNDKDLEGKLSMETYAQLRKGGEDHAEPVKPGDPDNSFLIRSLEGREKPKMPPKDEPRVPAEGLAMLKKWIAAGAPGPKEDVSILQTLTTPKVAASAKAPPVTAAAYSADGRWIALAHSRNVEIRDAATNVVVRTLSGLPAKVNAVHFTAGDSQLILAGGITGLHGVAQLRSVADGSIIRQFPGHSDVLYDAEISPDGKTLATAGYDRTIRLWQLADGKLQRTIDVHKGAIFALAWHPDGKVLASASADETVKLWRVSDGVRLDTLNQPQGEMTSVLFTRDGEYVIAAGGDKRIHLWRFVSKDAPALNPVVHSRFAHESAVSGIALSADGKHLLSSADDRTLKLWSVPDLVLEHAYEAQPDIAAVLLAAPQPDKFLAARMDGSTAEVKAAAAVTTTPSPSAIPSSTGSTHPNPGTSGEETEPNDSPAQAMPVQLPALIKGTVSRAGDTDLFRFHAATGEEFTLEVNAARSKSKLDSRLEILHPDGTPVEQVVLQATRDSWFTFRGKDSDTSDDFRLHNWAEMELNEYLYANGEVVKLWLYPRGPDSGYKVYPGAGKRHTCFGTPALVHALGAPAYVVTPLPPGSQPPPSGLPVFHVNYENDDDSYRRLGADSQLLFTAPVEGDYLVKLTDVRGFGGDKDFGYTLTVRPRQPDFKASVGGAGPKVSPGSGREITLSVERMEGFDGPVRIDIANLPAGFTASTPVEIEAGQSTAIAVISAPPDAANPDAAADKAVKVTATARIGGKDVVRDLGTLGDIQLGPAAKVTVDILPDADRSYVPEVPGQPLELSIHPGQTITAKVKAARNDFAGRIELGGDDSGRNLPHGLYVDNIGLNGLLIVEGQTERTFFITASRIAKPGTRLFHLRATADGGQASRPVMIRVLPAK
jgi:WD40 repeat protein